MKNKSQYRNPYELEDLRNILALEGRKKEFIRTYSDNSPEIKNLNDRIFWNERFDKESRLKEQDAMTKDKINKIISLIPNKSVIILDIGFGQGYLEEKLESSNKKYKLYGIDISSIAVKRANEKFKGEFREGDISIIKKHYKPQSFDVIVCLELIEHIPPRKILNFYKSIYSLLKKRGILIISTPLNEGLRFKKENPSGHSRDYHPAVVKVELEISGFKVLQTHQLYAFKNKYFLKKFLAKVFRNRWEPNNIIVKAFKA